MEIVMHHIIADVSYEPSSQEQADLVEVHGQNVSKREVDEEGDYGGWYGWEHKPQCIKRHLQ